MQATLNYTYDTIIRHFAIHFDSRIPETAAAFAAKHDSENPSKHLILLTVVASPQNKHYTSFSEEPLVTEGVKNLVTVVRKNDRPQC